MANRIKGITVEIGGDVTGLDKALKDVNSTIKNTQGQLKDVERLLKLDPTNTELLNQKQRLLSETIGATKDKLEALKTAQEQAKQQMESGDLGKDKYDALQREIVATEQELQKLAKEAADANTALTKIGVVGATLESVGGKITSVGQSLTTHVTLPIVAAGTAIIKTAGDFDQSMAQVKAITGATGEDFESLRDLAIDLGAKTAYSAVECADAMTEMGKAGWSTQQIIDGMAGVLDAAASSSEGLAAVSTIIADAVSGFGLEAADASRVADVLAHSANAGTIDIADLGETFKYVAPMAQSMGLSLEDVTTAATAMSMAGIKGSQAGTSLRRMLTNLVKPSESVAAAMDELGISITNDDGSFLSLNEIIDVLRVSFDGLTDDEKAYYAATLAGANGQSGLLALLNLSAEEYAHLSEEINNCTGEAERTATVMQDNLNSKVEQLGGALESLAIKLGDILLPKLKELIEKVTGVVEKFTQAPKPVQETIIKIAGIAAAVGPVLLVLGKLTTTVGQGMQAFSAMGKGILNFVNQAKLGVGAGGKLAAAIGGISAPVLGVVAAVAILVAAFVHLWKNNEEFRTKVTAIWDGIKQKFENFSNGIKERLASVGIEFTGFVDTAKKIWDKFCEILAPVFEGAFNQISIILGTVFDVITGLLDVFIGIFSGDWEKAWKGVKEVFEGVWNGIKNLFGNVINIIKNVINVFLGWFGTDWNTVWSKAKEFVTTTWENIKTTVSEKATALKKSVSEKVTALVEGVKEKWENLKQMTSDKFNAIKDAISDKWTAIKESVTNKVDSMKEAVSDKFNAIKESAVQKFEDIKEGIRNKIESAKETVSNAIEKIKGLFNFHIEWPHVPLPHFGISPAGWQIGDLLKGVIPSLNVEWYKKAMNRGMILNGATIFGMNGNSLLAGGEAGSETVVGTKSLMNMIGQAVNSAGKKVEITNNVYVNGYGSDMNKLAQKVGEVIGNTTVQKLRMSGSW